MDSKTLLWHVIEVYENDLPIKQDDDESRKVNKVVSDIIVCLTRLILGFRYCSNANCKCSPEFGAKFIFDNHNELLRKYFYQNVYESLRKLCSSI